MSRPIVLSNGELHVGLNNFGLVHDFYYPYVGHENHAADNSLRHHVGVYVDGAISWLDSGDWSFEFSYPHRALVGHIIAKNPKVGIILEFDDLVDSDYSALMRNIHVINDSDRPREIKVFLHQAFIIGDSMSNTDTVQYLPDDHAMFHYNGRRAFVASCRIDKGDWYDQYTCGLFGMEGKDGTFRDAEDGELTVCNVEHGHVDSTFRLKLNLEAHDSARISYWIACGMSLREALFIHKAVQKHGFIDRYDATCHWWHEWIVPLERAASKISSEFRKSFIESGLIAKAHMDKRGAVIASTDTAMLEAWRDVYGYAWPRDGAYVLWPFIRMGYYDEPYRFFEFCRRGLNPNGYLSHKYRADGALGSSWHPYLHDDGTIAPPIQEDETALVLFVFTQFYMMNEDPKLLHDFYESMVEPMAQFLCEYVDHHTGLPRPSYDLWEERFIVSTYTVSIVVAALRAAAGLAEARADTDNVIRWRSSADGIAEAARKHLYDEQSHVFYKGLDVHPDGTTEIDKTLDVSSTFGAFMYGLYATDSDEVRMSMKVIRDRLGTPGSYGLPRYERDAYLRADADSKSNWWPIASLWWAQYELEVGDKELALSIIRWIQSKMAPTGVLSEQISPTDGETLSVAPLAWSQAEYLSTLLDTVMELSNDE